MIPSKNALLVVLVLAVTLPLPGTLRADGPAPAATGTWYLALDSEPFGLPPGTIFPGLAIIGHNGTFQIVDGGDFGGAPFPTRDSAQFGSWRRRGSNIEAVTLFLQGDAITGDVVAWQRVELLLTPDGSDGLVGTVNVFGLACNLPAPFPVFGCPDPIDSASAFVAVPPFDVGVELKRLEPVFLSSD